MFILETTFCNHFLDMWCNELGRLEQREKLIAFTGLAYLLKNIYNTTCPVHMRSDLPSSASCTGGADASVTPGGGAPGGTPGVYCPGGIPGGGYWLAGAPGGYCPGGAAAWYCPGGYCPAGGYCPGGGAPA